MYKKSNLAFRPIEHEDLEILRKNRNDMDTLLFLGIPDLVSPEQQKNWYLNLQKDKKNYWFAIIELEKNEIIGVLRFQNIDYINSNTEIGADVFKEFRGKGYGKKIYLLALDYLFNHFNMNMVYLKVADFNEVAKKLYLKVGFEFCGFYPEAIYRFGKYWDIKIMAITRTKYFQLYENQEF